MIWKFVGKFFDIDYFLIFLIRIYNFINTFVDGVHIECDRQGFFDVLVKLVILKQHLKLVLLLQVFNTFWKVLRLATQYVKFFTLFSRPVADFKIELW